VLDGFAHAGNPLFSVGSSGVEMALGDHWRAAGLLPPPPTWADPGPAAPLVVASGSCSPVTAGQIAWALSQGFAEIALDTAALARHAGGESLLAGYVEAAAAYIGEGRSLIIHTSRGNDDERVAATDAVLRAQGWSPAEIQSRTSELYGRALGRIVRGVLERTAAQRVVLAGGDTSSYAARALGIAAVEMIAPLAPGAPLCRAHAPGSPVDGREINFKGGQVGREDYFGMLARGKALE
jgi:3-oxoisoapionate kinase